MRTCGVCKETKPLSDFHTTAYYCRPCKSKMDKGRYRDALHKSPYRSPECKARAAQHIKETRDPLKDAARRAVRNAVSIGMLVRPDNCSVCGKAKVRKDGKSGIQAHHYNGYENALDVMWLCPACHRVEHHPDDGKSPRYLK